MSLELCWILKNCSSFNCITLNLLNGKKTLMPFLNLATETEFDLHTLVFFRQNEIKRPLIILTCKQLIEAILTKIAKASGILTYQGIENYKVLHDISINLCAYGIQIYPIICLTFLDGNCLL